MDNDKLRYILVTRSLATLVLTILPIASSLALYINDRHYLTMLISQMILRIYLIKILIATLQAIPDQPR